VSIEALDRRARRRSRTSRTWDMFSAYLRLDIIEEFMFPGSNMFRYAALVAPVFTYFFQAEFLDATTQYAVTLVGISVAAGLQFSLLGFTLRLQLAQERGVLETYLVEPVSWRLIPLGMNVWSSIVGMVATCAMLTLGCLIGARLDLSATGAFLGVLVLGIIACNVIGLLSAAFLVLFKRGEPILAAYGLIASLLGGALFSIDVLPPWIRWMSYLVPHAYVISASRSLLVPGYSGGGIMLGPATIALVAFCAGGLVAGLWLFHRTLEYARRAGLLIT
jgi:ABC-2 type transport system permease protein